MSIDQGSSELTGLVRKAKAVVDSAQAMVKEALDRKKDQKAPKKALEMTSRAQMAD